MIRTVNIVGFGKAGRTFYHNLRNKVSILDVYNRTPVIVDGANYCSRLEELNTNADLTIICVADDAIEAVVKSLPETLLAVHCSGAVSIDAMKRLESYGVLYPFQTLSADHAVDFSQNYFLVEGSESSVEERLLKFCRENLSGNSLCMKSSHRAELHLAGIYANNFTTYLLHLASERLGAAGVNDKIMEPLIQETIQKFFRLGYLQAQTGPARRGDQGTILKHLSRIQDEKERELYQLISTLIQAKFKA